jgi:hypothetical protein
MDNIHRQSLNLILPRLQERKQIMKKATSLICTAALFLTIAAIAAISGCSEGGGTEANPGGENRASQTTTAATAESPEPAATARTSVSSEPTPPSEARIEQCRDNCEHEMVSFSPFDDNFASEEIVPAGIFNNERMTLSGVPEFMPVVLFDSFLSTRGMTTPRALELLDETLWREFVFLKNGAVVNNGFVEPGMTIGVYHVNGHGERKSFCGEYTVQELRPVTNPQPLFYLTGPSSENIFRFSELTMLIERGTAISDVLEELNELWSDSTVTHSVRANNQEVTSGRIEENMVLRTNSGSNDFIDYVVVFI